MKNLKTIIAVVALGLFTSLTAVANDNINPKAETKKALRSEIVSLIGKEIPLEIKQSLEAEVSFVVNNKNQLVVVSIDSNHDGVDSFVKAKLNYKTVKIAGIKKGEVYRMPLKIQKPR